jgi:hypothetical protein
MRAILGWGGAGICGWFGWWLGEHVGLATAVIPGAIGTGVGLYAGNRWFDENLR